MRKHLKPKINAKNYRGRIEKVMKTRQSEKVGENLAKGWEALEKGKIKSGLSLYLHAVTVYNGSFKAVNSDLIDAKRKGFLPDGFVIPKNAMQLKKILKKFQ